MASKAVVDAVAMRLTANWTRCPVLGLNEGNTAPTDGSAFLQAQFPVANETPIDLAPVGQRTFREEGILRFVLAMPSGVGLSTASQWADELRALFRAAQFGPVNCLGASGGPLADGNESGNYFRLSVVVEYYADLLA